MVSNIHDKIEKFLNNYHSWREPLQKIIKNMINKCRYLNGESVERHNFGNIPSKLNNIPDYNQINEDKLYKILEENNEKAIIELLWGDVQLGKRIHACIIMWISLYIYDIPVLYIFRNLNIDMSQLRNDIQGTDEFSFNYQFIKIFFEEYLDLKEHFKKFNLPNIRKIDDNIIDRYHTSDAYNTTNIDCCLMNYKQLEKIDKKFNEYVCTNKELVNISVIVDESDLMAPSSSNDDSCKTDETDASKTEKMLAKIYKKCRYVLLITGTAHSLLYNVTTKISKDDNILIKISKVHKMIRTNEYYGLFNNKINFEFVDDNWWNKQDNKDEEIIKYDIINDYKKNIKKIIEKIESRDNIYNSLLISEERIKNNHTELSSYIIDDFPNLFVIIYNGDKLLLYLPKKYLTEFILIAIKEDRLKDEINNNTKKEEKNHYYHYYFKINTKKHNIKQIYKLIRMLFNDYDITSKTCITITGKYGERGYSFVSDDYNTYSFHLTDQYYVSHSSYNCTTISQKLRLQGKYNDDKPIVLTLWTTHKLKEILDDFFIKFIQKVEEKIMFCSNWIEIKDLVEANLNDDLTFIKYINSLDTYKKRKNIKKESSNIKPTVKEVDIQNNIIENILEIEFINEIKEMSIKELKYEQYEEYGKKIGHYEKKYCKMEIKLDEKIFNLINKFNNKKKPKRNEDKYLDKDYKEIKNFFINNIYKLKNDCDIKNYYHQDNYNKNIYDWISKIKNREFYDTIGRKNNYQKLIIFDNKEEYSNYNDNNNEHKILSNVDYSHYDDNKKYVLNLVYDINNSLYLFIRYQIFIFNDKLNVDNNKLNYLKYIDVNKSPYKIIGNKIKFSVVKKKLPSESKDDIYYKSLEDKTYKINKDNKIEYSIVKKLQSETEYEFNYKSVDDKKHNIKKETKLVRIISPNE